MPTEEELKIYEPYYLSLENEVLAFLGNIQKLHSSTIHVYNIDSRIKKIASINEKINKSAGKYKKLTDLGDIVGTRVICHCASDMKRFDDILQEEFKKAFLDFKRIQIIEDSGYKGVHYDINKEFDIGGKKEKLFCEIQLRTVLQDAWAILSHQYGYKQKTEGDSDILKQSVSGILGSCENLWELVKKSTRGNENISDDEASLIYQDVKDSVHTAENFTDIEKLVSANKVIAIEDIINKEFLDIKKLWAELRATEASSSAIEMLEKMEHAVYPLLIIGILCIKHDKILLLRKVLDLFGPIASLSDLQGGLRTTLSVPGGSLHNIFYYLGTYALKKKNGQAVHLLLNYKMEQEYNGKLYYIRLWDTPSILAPEVVHGAELTFNRLLKDFEKNTEMQEIFGIANENFLSLACEFNMLFCLKAMAEGEIGEEGWAYPNFGRYYGNRVSKLIERIKNREEYERFVEVIFDEKIEKFKQNFDSRLGKLTGRLGGGFFWSSIKSFQGPH